MKLGFSYIRFSSRHQAKGHSLERQTTLREAWCNRNGVTLDTSMTLQDLAVSGWKGENHKGNPDRYALAAFLAACQSSPRRVPPDSYLIIENLDRLSREHYRAAFSLFNDILDHKVNVVTLTPERIYRHDSIDPTDSIIAIVEMARGNSESVIKSDRVGKAWAKRKKNAVEKKTPVSAMCPKWLELVDGKYRPIPDRVKIVRQIFRWSIDGNGIGVIARKLNDEQVKPFNERGKDHKHRDKPAIWQKSSVARILSNRAVLGEYQPGEGGRRKPVEGVGPVLDYYPRIVEDKEFAQSQLAVKNRAHRRSDKRAVTRNLFTGLLWTLDDKPYNYHGSKNKAAFYEYLAPSGARLTSAAYVALPYCALERAVLNHFSEIKAADLTTGEETKLAERLTELSGLIEEAKEKVTKFEDKIYSDPDNDTWPRLMKKAKDEADTLTAEYQEVRLSLSSPMVETVAEAQSLIKTATDPEKRARLKSKLAALVEEIGLHVWADVIDEQEMKVAWAQIKFKHSRQVRNIVFSYTHGYGDYRPAKVHVYAVGDAPLDELPFTEDNAVDVERFFAEKQMGQPKEI